MNTDEHEQTTTTTTTATKRPKVDSLKEINELRAQVSQVRRSADLYVRQADHLMALLDPLETHVINDASDLYTYAVSRNFRHHMLPLNSNFVVDAFATHWKHNVPKRGACPRLVDLAEFIDRFDSNELVVQFFERSNFVESIVVTSVGVLLMRLVKADDATKAAIDAYGESLRRYLDRSGCLDANKKDTKAFYDTIIPLLDALFRRVASQ